MHQSTYSITFDGQADADGLLAFRPPRQVQIVGIEKVLGTKTGSVTAHTIDINVGGNEALAGILAEAAANEGASWKSEHLGGSARPITVPKDSKVTVDVHISGGGNQDVTLHFHVAWSEA